MNKLLLAFFFGILVFLPFIYFVLKVFVNTNFTESSVNPPSEALPTTSEPYRGTLEGEVICLPHKDKTGPQTLECAIGLRTNEEKYYALDTNIMSATPPTYHTGDRIKANGVITPVANLSSDHWQKYDVEGIFSVTDSFEVLESQ